MERAIEAAKAAGRAGEVPVGAVVTGPDGAVLAVAANEVERRADPLAHAEMLALSQARALRGGTYLSDCVLTVTLEPCALCAAAIAALRVGRLVFGAYDPKGGAVEHGPRLFSQPTIHHRPEMVGGVREAECAALLKEFFADRRDA